MEPAAHPASASAGGSDEDHDGANAIREAVMRPPADQPRRADEDEGPANELMRMTESIGAGVAFPPAWKAFLPDLYPLICSSGRLYSSAVLLKLLIGSNPTLSHRLLLAAVWNGNQARFRALLDAGADVNGGYDDDGEPVLGFARDHSRSGNTLLQLAVMMGKASMIPTIVAVPELVLKRSVSQLAQASLNVVDGVPEDVLPDDALACVSILLLQRRVTNNFAAVRPEDIARLAAATGNLDALALLHSFTATRNGSVYRGDASRSCTHEARRAAEAYGQIPVLQWLLDRSREWTNDWASTLFTGKRSYDVGSVAAMYGRIDTLDWLADRGFLGDAAEHQLSADVPARPNEDYRGSATKPDTLWRAAGCSGSLAVVDHLRGHFKMGAKWNTCALIGAVQGGHFPLVKQLIAAGCPVRQSALRSALCNNRLNVMTHLLDHADGTEIDLTDAGLCDVAAQCCGIGALELLREHGVPWTCAVITAAIGLDEVYTPSMDSHPCLKRFLHWALENGVPLGNDADPDAALRHACQQDCYVGLRMLVDCYSQRQQHLDLNVAAEALVCNGAEHRGGRRRSYEPTAEACLQWLHDEMGFRFTVEHMRAAVVARWFQVILKLRELGCPWDASVIPWLILNKSIRERDDDATKVMLRLIERGCPMDITTCQTVDANPQIEWARQALNGMQCPCGHALHQ